MTLPDLTNSYIYYIIYKKKKNREHVRSGKEISHHEAPLEVSWDPPPPRLRTTGLSYIHVDNIFTWSQVSSNMTSSVAKSGWVKSPGTSSTWEEQQDIWSMTSPYWQTAAVIQLACVFLWLSLTIIRPVLLEQPNRRGGLTIFRRVEDVWYSFFPPRADQNPAEERAM